VVGPLRFFPLPTPSLRAATNTRCVRGPCTHHTTPPAPRAPYHPTATARHYARTRFAVLDICPTRTLVFGLLDWTPRIPFVNLQLRPTPLPFTARALYTYMARRAPHTCAAPRCAARCGFYRGYHRATRLPCPPAHCTYWFGLRALGMTTRLVLAFLILQRRTREHAPKHVCATRGAAWVAHHRALYERDGRRRRDTAAAGAFNARSRA